tara:strand:- start:301 stop:801 length:501 start_codon:yes stop_codon:yes gene_type:complete
MGNAIHKITSVDFPTDGTSLSVTLDGSNNYYYIIRNLAASQTGTVEWRFLVGGSEVSNGTYDSYMRIGSNGSDFVDAHNTDETSVKLFHNANNTNQDNNAWGWIYAANESNATYFTCKGVGSQGSTVYNTLVGGRLNENNVVNGIKIFTSGATNFGQGKLIVYGMA